MRSRWLRLLSPALEQAEDALADAALAAGADRGLDALDVRVEERRAGLRDEHVPAARGAEQKLAEQEAARKAARTRETGRPSSR